MDWRRPLPIWTLPVLLLLALGVAIAAVKSPWCDEGWFTGPAHQMAFHASNGTPALEPTGHYLDKTLTGINQRTLVIPPMHLWLLAGWYKLWGPGLTTPRLYGLLWGALGLLLLGALVQWTWRNPRLTLLFTFLLSIDLTYLWSSADARMDIQTAVLGWAAWLSYLSFRKHSMAKALLVSNSCLALGALHHPNAAYAALSLAAIILYLDRSRLSWILVALSALPYLVAAALWAFYIAPDWGLFQIQFGANLAGRANIRTRYLAKPGEMLWLEIAVRYLAAYGVWPVWLGSVPNILRCVPFLYAAVFVIVLTRFRTTIKSRTGLLAGLCAIQLLLFTFLMSFKSQNYLIFLTPLWDIWLAKSIWTLWHRRNYSRVLATVLCALFVIAHLTAVTAKMIDSPRQSQFNAAHTKLDRLRSSSQSLWAPTYWGIEHDFTGYREDIRLGFHTGERRDWIVLDHWNAYYDTLFALDEPAVAKHVNHLLNNEYTLAASFGEYRIYRRIDPKKSN